MPCAQNSPAGPDQESLVGSLVTTLFAAGSFTDRPKKPWESKETKLE